MSVPKVARVDGSLMEIPKAEAHENSPHTSSMSKSFHLVSENTYSIVCDTYEILRLNTMLQGNLGTYVRESPSPKPLKKIKLCYENKTA